MYSVYADNRLLYSPDLANDNYVVLSPKINYEVNKAGSFSFLLPPNNPLYDSINKLTTIITVYDGNDEIFRGRVLHDEKDFYNRKNVYCEGELSFFLDSIIRPYDFSGSITALFTQFVNNHNSQVEEAKRFTVGNITVTDPNNYIVRSSLQYPNTWDEMNEKFLDLLGGYIRTRKDGTTRYVDYVTDYGHVSNQIIEFGVNMLDISEYISADEVFTCLIPLGVQADDGTRLTIKSVNNNVDYLVDMDAVALFGYIWKKCEWDDVTIASNLLTKGRAYLANGIELAVSLTMKAVDLHLLNVNTNRIAIGDMVRVISIPHRIDRYFMCTKISLDLVNPDKSEYTFGYTYSTMTEKSLNNSNKIQSVSSSASAAAASAQSASQSAANAQSAVEQVIVDIPTEYVKTTTFATYQQSVDNTYAKIANIPTKTSDLTNDSGFLTQHQDLSDYVTDATYQTLVQRVAALENQV